MSNMDFYLVELSQGLQGYGIIEFDSHVELLFARSKIVALSWLVAAGSFTYINNKSSEVPTS